MSVIIIYVAFMTTITLALLVFVVMVLAASVVILSAIYDELFNRK